MSIPGSERTAPVFVVGSARSGTTLLYHTLLSTGQYAVYRGEPAVFDLLQPRYGDLSRRSSRRRLLREWPRSHLARASGFDDPRACEQLLDSVRSNGEFLRQVMSALAARQGVPRWAAWGPDNLLLMPWIKRELPDARFIHMVRDGRDVALSIGTEGWIRPFPWDRRDAFLVAAMHWQWKLQRARIHAPALGGDYLELHFEALVERRSDALSRLAQFLGHAIDPAAVEQEAMGTLCHRNSTFGTDRADPVGRWRRHLTPRDVTSIERAIGATLEAFGYECSTARSADARSLASVLYPRWFSAKHALRTHTVFGRAVDPGRLRLDASVTRPTAARSMPAENTRAW